MEFIMTVDRRPMDTPRDPNEPLPKFPVGTVFLWRGKMWRRGRGILYRARPLFVGIIMEGFWRREKKRQRRAESAWRLILKGQDEGRMGR
jgi:hypothetical protein